MYYTLLTRFLTESFKLKRFFQTMSLIPLVLPGIGGTVSAIATLMSLANGRPPTNVIDHGLPNRSGKFALKTRSNRERLC